MINKIDEKTKLIKEIRIELKNNKSSFIEIIKKVQIKLSSFYQLNSQNAAENIELFNDSKVKDKIFQNIIKDVNNLQDSINDFFTKMENYTDNINKVL